MEIRFGQGTFYLMIVASVMSLIVGGVYAIGSGDPTFHGHDFGELEFPDCSDGETLRMENGEWVCGIIGVISGGGYTVVNNGFENPTENICIPWGDATCDSATVVCPLGTNRVPSGYTRVFYNIEWNWGWHHYICVKTP